MTSRSDILYPRVTRKVLSQEELYTVDLQTGKTIKKMTYCKYHKRLEWVGDFYLESDPKSKHANAVRSMCIEGWDITLGKIPTDNKDTPATLMHLIEELV